MQILHFETDGFAHAPHLMEPPLVDPHVERRPQWVRGDDAHLGWRSPLARPERDPGTEPRDLLGTRQSVDAHAIALFHSVARMHEVMREFAIVGDEQQSAGVGVEST